MNEMKVADLTIHEFEELIRRIVLQTFLDLSTDPDKGLKLREDFIAELEASLMAVESGEAITSAEEVAARLGLTW